VFFASGNLGVAPLIQWDVVPFSFSCRCGCVIIRSFSGAWYSVYI